MKAKPCSWVYRTIALTLLLCTTLLGTTSAGKVMEIKFASEHSSKGSQSIAIRETFVTAVEKLSNGQMKVSFFDNGQLGKEADILEACQLGAIEMLEIGNFLQVIEPKLGLVNLPYLFKDADHAFRVLDVVGSQMTASLPSKGIRHLAFLDGGFRHMATKKPVNSIADTSAIKIRVPPTPIYTPIMKSLGFNVVVIPYGESYTAIQTGVADGIELPFSLIYAGKFYEVAKYLAITYHMWDSFHIVASEKWWKTLTPEQQDVIRQAAKATSLHQRKLEGDYANSLRDTLVDSGMTATEPDLRPFREAAKRFHQEYASEKGREWAGALVEAMLAVK